MDLIFSDTDDDLEVVVDGYAGDEGMDDEDGSEHDRYDVVRQRVGVDASVEEDSELDATTVADGEAHEQVNDEQGRELMNKQ